MAWYAPLFREIHLRAGQGGQIHPPHPRVIDEDGNFLTFSARTPLLIIQIAFRYLGPSLRVRYQSELFATMPPSMRAVSRVFFGRDGRAVLAVWLSAGVGS